MKRGFVLTVFGLFLLRFVSAQFFDNYNSFSITNFFNTINPQDLTFLALFIIFFALIFLVLTRLSLFRDAYGNPNKGIAGVISLALSLLITYYMYRSGFNLEGIFSGFGISSDLFYPILAVILVVAAIFIVMYLSFAGLFMITGLLLLVVGFFTNLIYESGIAIAIGGILLFLGLMMRKWSRKKLIAGGRAIGGQIKSDYPKASAGWLWPLLGILLLVIGIAFGSAMVIIIGVLWAFVAFWVKFKKPRQDGSYLEPHPVNID